VLYGIRNILAQGIDSFAALQSLAKTAKRGPWINVGGQLMKAATVDDLKTKIKKGKINGWAQLHETYEQLGQQYAQEKLEHAVASLLYVQGLTAKTFTPERFQQNLEQSVTTMSWITDGIYRSREKDYQNPYRSMTYESQADMEAVVGKLEDNSFIQQTIVELKEYKKKVKALAKDWKL
jgi:hypothetical protein